MSDKIKKALQEINDKHGVGTAMIFGETEKRETEVISTGVPTLDNALGINGLPKGKIVEVFGPEQSGKTTLTLQIIAEAQKAGGLVAFIDVEHALNTNYAKQLGVDVDSMILSQPDSGEQAMEVMEALITSGEVAVVVIDSVAGLASKAELDGEMGDSLPGKVARLLGQACRKIIHTTSTTNCLVIFINQLRATIGGFGYGPTETTTGGKALRYFTCVRLEIRRIGSIKGSGEKIVGQKTKIKIVKNKFAPPHQEVEVDLIYGEGISKTSALLDMAIEKGVVVKKGAWFYFNENSIGQGRENAREYLKDENNYKEIYSLTNK